MFTFFLQNVPLAHIRHNDLACYVVEGFGARPVEEWPVFNFFTQYLCGDKEAAIQNYVEWYTDQLSKYHNAPKKEGGMHKGSLYSLIETKCGTSFPLVDEVCKKAAIRERVEQRFQLLEAIREQGYKPEMAERIVAVKKNGHVYLRGGHHRVAVLQALGESELPSVLVFPNQLVYNLFYFLRNIIYGNLQK